MTLLDDINSLKALRTKRALLVSQKQELERDAWLAAPQTIARARKLMADATLHLLSHNLPVTSPALQDHIVCNAIPHDRYAVLLCQDWLVNAPKTL